MGGAAPAGLLPDGVNEGRAWSVLPVPPALVREADANERTDAGTGTRTGTATGPGPDSAPDPRHHGRTGEPPAADSGPARTRLAGPDARLGRGWFA